MDVAHPFEEGEKDLEVKESLEGKEKLKVVWGNTMI